MSRPGIEPRSSTVGGEHSRKKPFEQLVNSYSEHRQSTYERMTSGECSRQVQYFLTFKVQSVKN
jgi:hypothetical protein